MHTLRLTLALAALTLVAPGVASAGASPADALVFRSANGAVRVFDPVAGPLRTLPAGALSADGASVLTAQVRGGSTLVRRIATRSGAVLAHRRILGAWGFQVAAQDGSVVAGGDDGLVVPLVAAGRANDYGGSAPTTRIAVLPSSLTGHLRLLRLHGNFGIDALGPAGRYLYLIQHLEGEHYKVRAYDLRAGRLDPQTVIDKAEPNEKMAGLPLARAENPAGTQVLTLYRRPSGVPFVHVLMADTLYAFCIDLPPSARVDVSDPSTWGIAERGGSLFIANAATGWLAVVDLSTLKVARSTSLGAQAASGPAPRPLAASEDGLRLYLARPQGLVPIDGSTLEASAPLTSRAFGSLALGRGGSVLYGAGGGSTQAFDASTGALDGGALRTGALSLVGVVGGD